MSEAPTSDAFHETFKVLDPRAKHSQAGQVHGLVAKLKSRVPSAGIDWGQIAHRKNQALDPARWCANHYPWL
jgi:hypothetical protein